MEINNEEAFIEDPITAKTQFKFLEQLNIDQDVKRRLSLHLENTIKGNDNVYITPMGREHGPEFILAEWNKIYEANMHKFNKPLIDLENLNKSQYGPRSIAKPWSERKDSVLSYYSDDKYKLTRYLSSNIKSEPILRPIKLDNAVKLLKNNTNAGLPFYTKKGKLKTRYLDADNDYLYRNDPCILFTRTQSGSDSKGWVAKTRNVWGYPMANTINEEKFYRPLLIHQMDKMWRSALIGPSSVDRSITRMINQAKISNKYLISIDFSSYDASVKYELQRQSFNYIKSKFQKEYQSGVDAIFNSFNTIGLVTPDGVLNGEHGVPSGSTFTNEVDSIAQYLVAKHTLLFDDSELQIQGDDGVYVIGSNNVDLLYDVFNYAGLSVNEDKSYISKDFVVYLQNLYHNDYRDEKGLIGGIYPTYRALCRLVYQERWSDFEDYDLKGIDYYSIRALTILENCKYHPLFHDLVKFILKLDKYSLKFSSGSLAKYVSMLSQGTGQGDVTNNQYGDDASGLRSFNSYKIIRDIA